MIDQREIRHLIHQNKKLKTKIVEQAQTFQEERAKLAAINRALRASLENEQRRNREAIEEFNNRITQLEMELRRAQSGPPPSPVSYGFASMPTAPQRSVPSFNKKSTIRFSDLEAEGQRLAEETNRILRQCKDPQTTLYVPPQPIPTKTISLPSFTQPKSQTIDIKIPVPKKVPIVEEEESEESAHSLSPPIEEEEFVSSEEDDEKPIKKVVVDVPEKSSTPLKATTQKPKLVQISSNTPSQPKPKPSPKQEPKPKPKPSPKQEPKPKPKPEPKQEPKPKPKPEPKQEPEPNPKSLSTPSKGINSSPSLVTDSPSDDGIFNDSVFSVDQIDAPANEPEPEPIAQPQPEPESDSDPEPERAPKPAPAPQQRRPSKPVVLQQDSEDNSGWGMDEKSSEHFSLDMNSFQMGSGIASSGPLTKPKQEQPKKPPPKQAKAEIQEPTSADAFDFNPDDIQFNFDGVDPFA